MPSFENNANNQDTPKAETQEPSVESQEQADQAFLERSEEYFGNVKADNKIYELNRLTENLLYSKSSRSTNSIHKLNLLTDNGLLTQEEVFGSINNSISILVEQSVNSAKRDNPSLDPSDEAYKNAELGTNRDMGIALLETCENIKDFYYLSRDPKIETALKAGISRMVELIADGRGNFGEKQIKILKEAGYLPEDKEAVNS